MNRESLKNEIREMLGLLSIEEIIEKYQVKYFFHEFEKALAQGDIYG